MKAGFCKDNSGPKALEANSHLTEQLNKTDTSQTSRWNRIALLVDHELTKVAASTMREFAAVSWQPTLQPEELVNEFYLHMLRADTRRWENRKHFFASAASCMRNILIDRHRARKAGRRPDPERTIPLETLAASNEPAVRPALHGLQIAIAIERLRERSPRQAEMIELRFFGGMEIGEIAKKLELSEKTVQRDWLAARAFLYAELADHLQSRRSS